MFVFAWTFNFQFFLYKCLVNKLVTWFKSAKSKSKKCQKQEQKVPKARAASAKSKSIVPKARA
jgi:hypothetical protein